MAHLALTITMDGYTCDPPSGTSHRWIRRTGRGRRQRSGAREIASYVIGKGHRRVAIIGGPEALWTSDQRLSGYREAIAAHGLNVDEIPVSVGDHRQQSGNDLAKQALAGAVSVGPTLILCANDLMAFGVLGYCRQASLRVPEDVSVTGLRGRARCRNGDTAPDYRATGRT